MSLKDHFGALTGRDDDPGWSAAYDAALIEVEAESPWSEERRERWHARLHDQELLTRTAQLGRMAALRVAPPADPISAGMYARIDLATLDVSFSPRPETLALRPIAVPDEDAAWNAFWESSPRWHEDRVVLGERTLRRDSRRVQWIRRSWWVRPIGRVGVGGREKSDLIASVDLATYRDFGANLAEGNLLCAGNPFFVGVGVARGWLAFHPGCARAHGLAPDPASPFGWCDRTGERVVESIAWCDGSPLLGSVHDAAEGWLVLASRGFAGELRRDYRPWEWAQIREEQGVSMRGERPVDPF